MLEIINCTQSSLEWTQARLGIPTASEFASILSKGRGGTESRTRQTYLYKLAGERLQASPRKALRSACAGMLYFPTARESRPIREVKQGRGGLFAFLDKLGCERRLVLDAAKATSARRRAKDGCVHFGVRWPSR